MADTAPNATTVAVGPLIDTQPLNPFLLGTVALCMLLLIVDGYDVMVIGFVAPALARTLGVAGAALTPVFVLGQIGLAMGAFAAGPLADRFGRRRILLGCCVGFAVCTLVTPLMGSVTAIAATRLLAGIGLGGVLPNTIALISEMCPRRARSTLIMIMFSGFSIGSALAGLAVSQLVVTYGWKAPILLGGLAPIVLLPVLAIWLPESLRLLTLKGGRHDEVAAIIGRLRLGDYPAGTVFVSGEPPVTAKAVAALFSDRRGPMTVFLWITFFANLLDLNLLAAWLPTYLNHFAAIEPGRAAGVAAFYQVGGTIGTLMLGLLIDRLGAPRVLSAGYVLAALTIASIGMIAKDPTSLAVALSMAGFLVVGGQIGINAYASTLYPTAIRSTGVAWAFGIGRFGAMLGPALGGFMLAQGFAAEPTFIIAALPIMLAVISVLMVGWTSERRSREA